MDRVVMPAGVKGCTRRPPRHQPLVSQKGKRGKQTGFRQPNKWKVVFSAAAVAAAAAILRGGGGELQVQLTP